MKRLWKILKWTVAGLMGFILLLWLLLLIPTFQTWLTNQIASSLADDLNTVVRLECVDLDFFDGAVIKGIYIEDQNGDTLLYAPKAIASGLSLLKGKPLDLGDITIEQPRIFIHKRLNDSTLNVQFLIDAFTPEVETLDSSITHIVASEVHILDAYLLFRDYNASAINDRIDWEHLELKHLDIVGKNLRVLGDTVTCDLEKFQFIDHSGFALDKFTGKVRYDPEYIIVEDTKIESGESDINGRIAFKYKDINDFAEFNEKIKMNHKLQESHLKIEDLSWFAEELAGLNLEVTISGHVSGRVENLKCKDLDITIDENTRFQGDVTLDGLPNIDHTFITLDINRLTSTKADLDRIPHRVLLVCVSGPHHTRQHEVGRKPKDAKDLQELLGRVEVHDLVWRLLCLEGVLEEVGGRAKVRLHQQVAAAQPAQRGQPRRRGDQRLAEAHAGAANPAQNPSRHLGSAHGEQQVPTRCSVWRSDTASSRFLLLLLSSWLSAELPRWSGRPRPSAPLRWAGRPPRRRPRQSTAGRVRCPPMVARAT